MLVKNLHASMLRFCADFAAEHGITSVNFDAHGEEQTLPEGDLVGMSGLSFNVDDGFVYIKVMFGVSTKEDTNLFRLVELLAHLFEKVLPTCRLPAYDAETGEEVGKFVVLNGTHVLPINGSSIRPLQYVMVALASTVTLQAADFED